MKVKKIKVILSLFLFIFSAGVLCACGGEEVKGKLKFTQQSLTLGVNLEIDLSELVELTDCKLNDISFVSSDPEVVYITPGYKLITRSEGVSLISAKGYSDAILEISVKGTSIKFATPTNICYDESKGAVVWDAVYAGSTVASEYEIKISQEGQEDIITNTNKTSYPITGAGTFSVQITSIGRLGILSSEPSAIYTFSKLSAPTNLLYNDATGVLTWESGNTASAFRVFVNGVSSDVISSNQYELNLEAAGDYEVSVMACANASQENVFGAMSVNNLSLTRLEAPSLSVKKGVISWEDQQGNASAFKILTRGESTDEQLISKNVSGKYSYSLSGVVAGAYSVEMYAIGDSQNLIYESGKHYLNSATRQIDNIVKLEKKELTFDKANKLIKVVDFEASKGLMLTLNITTPTGSQSVNISTGELSFNFTSVGAYQFSLVNTAKTDRELNSDVGDVLTVVKLDQAKNVTHKVVNGVYTLENYQVENATNYALEIWKDSAKVAEVTNSNNQVDDLFTSAGAYSVKVVASGTDANKTYYLPSETLTDVTAIRLADLELVNNQVAKEITWQSVGTYNNLLYSYVLTGAYAEEGTKETSSFSYAGLGVGSYRLNVYAKITANEGQKTLILDSLNKNTFIDFKIEKTIQAPSLAFRTDDLNGYLVDITNVEGADQLNIMCNEGLIATIPTQEGSITTYNITNTLKGVGTGVKSNLFKIEVSAGNSNNEFYKESAKAELNFERLEDVLLTNDTVNKKIIWNNIGNGVIYKYQIAGAGTLNGSLTSTEFSYANIDVVGNYTFTAWATASQQNGQTIIIDSLNKTTTEFKVEKAIAAPNVTFKNDETNGYVLEIANVEGANQYSISCNNNLLEVVGRQSGDKTIYNVNDVLKGSGVGDNANLFNIKVSASSSENEFYKESLETSLNFERLADVQLVNNVESKKITWQSISQTIENIVYKYETTGMAALNGELSTNEFNYAGLTNVGDYTLSVWATVSRQSGDVIILDSLNKSTITFKVVTTLDAPELTFTKDTSAGTKYLLNISNVNNATQYDVYLNGTLSKQLTALGGEETNFDITSIFNLSGAGNNNDTYTFGVVAKNIAAGDYYMPSNNTELIVVKAAAPQNFNLQVMQMGKTITENITSNFYAGWLESTEITINGTAGTTITGINECTVQIKYIANDNKVANKYYIDSSYSEFIIKRITSNVYLNGSMVTWDANETEALNNQNFKVKLMLELNGEVFNVIDVTNNAGTGYDLSKLNIDLNLLKDSNAKISICYVAENLNNATASGEYYASSALNSFNISTANQLGLDIVEENEKVKFVLNNKKDGATYKLNGNITAELNSGDFETSITELLGIEEVYQSERALYLFTVTRVGNINSLSINEDESIMLPTNYPVGAGELVISGISKDENGNYSLKPIDASSETNINAYFKAQESDGQAYNYYLDGTPSTFTFKRLSALNVATNLNVSNDIVSWNKEEANLTNSYTYKVIFSSTNTEDVQKILPLSDTVSMNLNSSEYLSIIYALSGVEKYITIQKLVQGFTVNSGSVGYLTSQSSRYDLKILNAPTDIEITTTNLRQDDATISWKINIPTNYEVKSYSIKISNGKQEVAFESQGHYTLSPSDTYFKTAGDWTISVKAVGLYDTISSSYSNNISITRLQPSESLTITSDGIVRWAEVAGAESYILEYSYQLNDLSTQNKTIATSDNKFTTNNGYLEYSGIKDEELDLLFSGNITAKVYTVGTGSSSAKGTLTSVKDQTFNRIEAPEVELGNTNITFVNYENYTGSEKIFIKATIDGEVVVNGNVTPVKQDNKYVWTYPKTFYRQDGSVIEIGAGKQINFEIYASSTSPNTVNSNIISKSAIQLGEITNLRFIREDGKIKFYADNSNATASTTQVTIAGQIFENVGNLEVEITDNLLSLIPSSWTITAMAKCDSEGDNVYINSKETSISGVKLSNVTNIVVNANHTKVQWNNVANASAYKLSVFEINSPENVNYYDKTSLEEDMSSYNSGEYSFSVKTIGNIGNTYITENIILDSTYSNNVTITKLPKIQNISLNKGYISLDEVSGADAVVAVLSETLDGTTEEYQLTLIDGHPAGEAGNYYTSETLMAKLDSVEGKQYYLRFYAKATKNNYISSSFADIDGVSGSENYIIVRLFGESDYEISLNFKDIDGTNVNYAVTYATFKTNTNINDGILLDVDNEITPTTNLTYTVDANGTWEEGDHIIRYAQFGSSTIDADRVVYLTSFGQPRTIVKLSNSTINITKQRIQAGLYENMLQFSSVSNADGYYVYLDGELRILDKNQKFIDLSSYEAGEYSTIGIRAISKIPGYIAGITSYLLNTDRQPQAIKKITTPESFKIIDGALCWDISNEILNLVLGEIESPVYTSYSLIQEQYIKIKFTNKATGVATEFLDELAKYLYISESAKQQNESAYLEIANIASYNGFPSINYSFLDFAQSLIAGEYDVQAKIIGNPIDGSELPLFTSDYSRAITTYVGYAPQIRIENNNDVYNLKFTSVIVNSNYYSASSLPKYNLAGIYNESGKEVREIITSISPTTFNAANETITFNLTSLIQNGELTSKYSSLYVYIAGNTLGPNTSLNGKCSNIIKIKVLEEIKASVQRGVINWNAQADATKYVVTYRLTDNVEERFDVNYVEGLSIYEWGCEQLLANQAYTLTITAYGTQGVNASEGDLVIISGPKTYLGTIIKLQTIANEINAVEMEKGAYKWAHITNATNYDVVISETEITSGVYGTITDTLKVDEDNILNYYFYETTANDAVNYYYFRAVGTEDLALSSISIAYVNSNYSKYNKGIRNANISDVKFENGILTWITNNTSVNYRLQFQLEGQDGVTIYTTYSECGSGDICRFDTNKYPELNKAGLYSVQIQSFYQAKTETNTNSGIFYLISNVNEISFTKLDEVTDIMVSNGEVTWNYNGAQPEDGYHFRLHFEYEDDTTGKIVETDKYISADAGNIYSDIIFNDNIFEYPISLTIYVVPGVLDENGMPQTTYCNYAISIPVVYKDDQGNIQEIYQFNKLDEDKISITITDNGLLKIDWTQAIYAGVTGKCEYLIAYSTSENPENDMFIQVSIPEDSDYANTYYIFGQSDEHDFDIDGDYSLFFRIKVLPKEDNYMASAWTSGEEVKKPSKVQGLTFDEQSITYTWNQYQASEGFEGSFEYKIKDEVGYVNDDGEFVVQNAFILTATIGDEKYTPFILGEHRVSVAVVVKNSSTSALMSDYCDSVVSAMNLFAGGDGTQEDPYQITSAEQFNNIKYRLTKDGKNNSYYPCTINAEGEVIISDEIYNVDSANEIYHFVQTTHLEITKEYALANYQEESVNYEFNGVYDGAMYSLTLVWNENIDSESTISSLTIFEKVGVNGVLKNINVQLNLDNITIGKQISISVLAKNNYGTITNIIAGKLDVVSENVVKTISISNLEYSIDLSYVAYNNYGLIEKVETFYNTTITATSNNAVIGFGSVAISNLGGATISSVKNYGNLQISAGRVNVGGVVQYMQANSLTTQVANIGNIKVYLTSRIASTIGGIVGGCANGSLSYVYSVCDITIYSPSTVSINAYVGGIAGSMSGDAIEYSYSNITKNAKIESEFESYVYEGIYQIVGNLTQVSSSTSKAKYVYYNQLFNASSGTIPSGFIACTGTINSSNAKGLLNDGSKFADQAGNLVLTWETEFEKQIWIGFPEVEEQ